MISVIIPTYNNERLIGACLDSVLAQRDVEMEIIVVDDGSTDATGRIADDYASRFGCITTLHRPNGGPSAARNTALDIARGEWIAMVDGDDLLAPDALKKMLDVGMAYNDVDIVAGRCHAGFYDTPKPARDKSSTAPVILSGREVAETMLYQNRLCDALHPSSWGKLYRRAVWKDVRYKEGVIYEDLLLLTRVFADTGRVAVISDVVYYYRCNPDSLLHTFSAQRADALHVAKELTEHFADDARLAPAARSRLFSAAFNLWLLINANRGDMPQTVAECRATVRRLAPGQIFGGKVRFKNRLGALLQYFPFLFKSKFICKKLLAK